MKNIWAVIIVILVVTLGLPSGFYLFYSSKLDAAESVMSQKVENVKGEIRSHEAAPAHRETVVVLQQIQNHQEEMAEQMEEIAKTVTEMNINLNKHIENTR